MANKKDSGILLLLLAAGAAFAMMGGKAKAAAPPKPQKPLEDDDVEIDPKGTVTLVEDEIRQVYPPKVQPTGPLESPPLADEREITNPMEPTPAATKPPPSPLYPSIPRPASKGGSVDLIDVAKAAAAAADAASKGRPFPTSVPVVPPSASNPASLPPSSSANAHDPIPPGYADPKDVATAPAPGSKTSPRPNLPAGYDPVAARRQAPAIASHLARSGRDKYDRRLLEAWQRLAGLAPDRTYGGGTRGALLYYGVKNPPKPFFKPTDTIPFVPPEQR